MAKVSRSPVPRSYPLARRHTQAGHETSGISTQQQGHLETCSPRKLNTVKLLLKTFLSILSAILGKQTFDTWYASTLWGSYRRLFVTYSTHSRYKWKVSVGRLRKCYSPIYVLWQARLWFIRLWPHGGRFSDIADSRFKHGCIYILDLATVQEWTLNGHWSQLNRNSVKSWCSVAFCQFRKCCLQIWVVFQGWPGLRLYIYLLANSKCACGKFNKWSGQNPTCPAAC